MHACLRQMQDKCDKCDNACDTCDKCNITYHNIMQYHITARESKGTSEREEGGGIEGGWDFLAGYTSSSSPSPSPPLSPPPSLKNRNQILNFV